MTGKNHSENPWNGLRTYTEGELIYGRNGEIHALSLLILQNTQTVVYGRSGIGKSSILNAGIFPVMRRKGLFPVYIRLEHNAQQSYVSQIKGAVMREVQRLGFSARELAEGNDSETLWEFFHRFDYRDDKGMPVKPLAVFDQFEEIFTLESDDRKRNAFFRQLADLINNVMPDSVGKTAESEADSTASDDFFDLNLDSLGSSALSYKTSADYHLVFTLREDFLSYLERNTTDIPGLKNNRYCLQPINDEQAAEIIMSPRPGLVEAPVAKLIIEKVTGEKDFELDGVPEIHVDSAILSLYLSRLYSKMQDEGRRQISADLVEAYSDNIIEDFYTDAIKGMPEESMEWLEDTLVNADGRRDNRDRNTVMRQGHLDDEQLRHLTDTVKLLRQFSYGGDLRIEFIHDVLCPVIVARRSKRNEAKRIAAVEAAAEAERRKARRRTLAIAGAAVAVLAIAGAFFARNWWLHDADVSECYRDFTLVDGHPVGIGTPLDKTEQEACPLYYRLSHRGHANSQNMRVEVCSSNALIPEGPRLTLFGIPAGKKLYGNPSLDYEPSENGSSLSRIRYNTYLHFDSLLSQVKVLEFRNANNGETDRISALSDNGTPLFYVNRSELEGGQWYAFTDSRGLSLPLRDNGLDRVRVSSDSLGRLTSVSFYDRFGARKDVGDRRQSYGYNYSYPGVDVNTMLTERVNMYGNTVGPLIYTSHKGDTTEISYWTSYPDVPTIENDFHKISGAPSLARFYTIDSDTVSLRQTVRRELDAKGNVTSEELQYISDENQPDLFSYLRQYSYDDKGRRTGYVYTSRNERDLWKTDTLRLTYDSDGSLKSRIRTGNGRVIEKYETSTENGVTTTLNINALDFTAPGYSLRKDSVAGNTVYTDFYNRQGKHENTPDGSLEFASRILTTLPGKEDVQYFHSDTDGRLVKGLSSGDVYRIITELNADGTIRSKVRIAPDGTTLTSMMYYYDNGVLSGRSVMGIDGNAVRCPDYDEDGFGYYRLAYTYDFTGNYTGITAYDERKNSTPIELNGLDLMFRYGNMSGQTIELDEKDNPLFKKIRLTNDYWQYYPVDYRNATWFTIDHAVYLHILDKDSPLYRAGMRDGDIIARTDGTPATSVDEARRLLSSSTVKVIRFDGDDSYSRLDFSPEAKASERTADCHLHLMPLAPGRSTVILHPDSDI